MPESKNARLVRNAWEALSRGDVSVLWDALAPRATWRAVEDGPWNCTSPKMIVKTMAANIERGLAGRIEEIWDVGARVIVAFRLDEPRDGSWPLEDGIRYQVITFENGRVLEMKGCADRAT